MKTINVTYDINGNITSYTDNSSNFEQENNSLSIAVTFPTEFDTATKRAYIRTANNSGEFVEMTTNTLLLESKYMVKGTLLVGFEARIDTAYTRFKPLKININSFVSVGETIANNDYTVTVSIDSVETLPAGASATVVNLGTKKDVLLKLGIPQGISGDITLEYIAMHDTVVANKDIAVAKASESSGYATSALESKNAAAISESNAAQSATKAQTILSDATTHIGNTTSNPHAVTKSQLGLGDVDNTADTNKPISTAQQTALDSKQSIIDNSLSTVEKTIVGGINELKEKTDIMPTNIINAEAVGAIRTINSLPIYAYTPGNNSFAEGTETDSGGENAHAEGHGTQAFGINSHAEGLGTKATGGTSHSEGTGTIASGINSHSEGNGTKSIGETSHSEGSATTASGTFSHAEGSSTVASGIASHAGGINTIAKYLQYVIGFKNIESTASDTEYDATKEAFIIGNGGMFNRSNAFAVFFNGFVDIYNDIRVKTAGLLNTTAQTILGAINELKIRADVQRQDSPNAITATATGNPITLSDVQSDTDLNKVDANGLTTETGTGEKSPTNPYVPSGVENPVVTVGGKNLWKHTVALPITNAGLTVTYDNTTDEYIINGTSTGAVELRLTPFTSAIYNVKAGQKVSLSAWRSSGTNTGTIYPYIRSLDSTTINTPLTFSSTTNYINASVTPIKDTDISNIYFFVGAAGIAFTNLRLKVQIEFGDATPFEPYKVPVTYPITTTAPLYSLPNGTKDTIDVVSGLITHNVGKLVLTGNENWAEYSATETGWTTGKGMTALWENHLFSDTLNKQMGYDTSICSHFINTKNADPFTASKLSIVGVYTDHPTSTKMYFRWGLYDTATVADFKAYLAAQYAAGTPVTILYKLATPTTAQGTAQVIPTYSPTTIISTDKGTLSVTYNRDSNLVLATKADIVSAGDCKLLIGTFATRPTTVTYKTLYISNDKAVGNADRLTVNSGGTTWLQI